MIIGIDGNEANQSEKVGVGYFAYNLLSALYNADLKNNYWIYLKSTPRADLPPTRDNWHYVVCGPKKFWTRFALPLKLYTQSIKLDLFFSPSHYTPLFCPVPKIVSIMDLGYLDSPKQFTPKDLNQLKSWTEQSLKTSKHIVTISKFCKNDLIAKYKISQSKITVVYPVLPKLAKSKTTILKKWKLAKKGYFLSIGTLKPSKNIPFLLKAYKDYLDNAGTIKRLVIAGKKGWLYDEIFAEVKKLDLVDRILFTGYISPDEKSQLLSNAASLIIPSLFEGFGIPAIEAMQLNCPVIASNAGSLPEIVGKQGLKIDPYNSNTLTQALELISLSKNQKKYIIRGNKQLKKFQTSLSIKQLLLAFAKANSV